LASRSSSRPPSTAEAPAGAAFGWQRSSTGQTRALLAVVLVIATTGLAYELTLGALASYYLGDTVTVFSLVVGAYLSALGLGAYLSRFVSDRLSVVFVDVQLSVAVLGGLSVPAAMLSYAQTAFFPIFLLGLVLALGTLVGVELPLLLRLLEQRLSFRELVAKALGVDYVGALLGSIGFSLLLLPGIGLVRTSLLLGMLDALSAFASCLVLRGTDPSAAPALARRRIGALVVLVALAVCFCFGSRITDLADSASFRGRVMHAESSRFQRIVLTRVGEHTELYLNGHLQFSSLDEARYHELLVHPAMSAARARARVLIGGGGDGLALREVLRYPDVEHVTLIDLDQRVTELGRRHPALSALNEHAFEDARVKVRNQDAFKELRENRARFDVVILDFPDPSSYAVGKLFSLELYRALAERLTTGGVAVVQATSPLFARASYWTIVNTLEAAGLEALPYHAFMPSFGEWGFVLAAPHKLIPPALAAPAGLRFLTPQLLAESFAFPRDMARVEAPVNRLDNQALVSRYVKEWGRWDAW
jgi:spermidine synthase